MGAAALHLFLRAGARVHVIDLAEPSTPIGSDPVSGHPAFHRADLGDRSSIDAVVDQLPGRLDALINCAGIPNGGRFTGQQVMRVNWLGLRHLTESVLDRLAGGQQAGRSSTWPRPPGGTGRSGGSSTRS